MASKWMIDPSSVDKLAKEYNFFILESCRFYVDGLDKDELLVYYSLIKSAHSRLLIHKDKIEGYFKEYINALFSHRMFRKSSAPENLSELVIDLMLSELDMASILKHVNLGTQEVDVQSIKDSVKLEKINKVKKMHDRVLFFIDFYNSRNA
jgi:hypothetical protein